MLFIFFLVIVLAVPLIAQEKRWVPTGAISTAYDLVSNGDDIGEIVMVRSWQGDTGNRFFLAEETVTAKVSGWWGFWEMTSVGKTVIDEKGLLAFDYRIKENDKNWRIFGDRHDLELWCGARKVLTKKEKDEEDIVAISSMVAAETIPYAGEALTVLGILNNDGQNEGHIRIPLDTFDTTYSQLPTALFKKSKLFGKEKARILDTSELKTEICVFEETDQEQIETAGQTFRCHVFNVEKPKGDSTYWLAEDELGTFVVKESGRDNDGPYKIILKSYNINKEEKN
jgi:hypothetical protein